MPIQTITNLSEFRAGLAKLNEKIRSGLKNGNLTEIVALHWDLLLAVATSRANDCVEEKQKPSNRFLFDFLLAYGKARQKNQHTSPEFLNEMRTLLQNSANRSQESEERLHSPSPDTVDSAQAKNTQVRRSSERRLASSKIQVPRPVQHEPESDEEASAIRQASAIRPLKRHRVDDVTPSRERSPKRFHDIEASSGEDEGFIPSRNPSDAESDKTPDPKRPCPKSKRAKTRARTPASNFREKSEKPTHNDCPPAKATKWVHVQRCEMCVQHNRKCRVTYQMATCFYCNKHRRGCKGRGEEIERCSDVDDNESITSELEEDRKPDAKSRRGPTLNLVKVETSTPDPESKPFVDNHRSTKGKEVILTMAGAPSKDKADEEETRCEDAVAKDTPPGNVKHSSGESLQAPSGSSSHCVESSNTKVDQSDEIVKTWTAWMQDDFVRQSKEGSPHPLPPRPTYIRDWDLDQDIVDNEKGKGRTTEERLQILEDAIEKIIKKMTKIDNQLQSNDNGFDYMAGKLAFFASMVQVLDKKFDMVNDYHGELVHRMTVLRREMNVMAHDMYDSHGSDGEHNTYHDIGVQASHTSSEEISQGVEEEMNIGPAAKYIPVHSSEKLAALGRQWSGGTSTEPIDLEEDFEEDHPTADAESSAFAACDQVEPPKSDIATVNPSMLSLDAENPLTLSPTISMPNKTPSPVDHNDAVTLPMVTSPVIASPMMVLPASHSPISASPVAISPFVASPAAISPFVASPEINSPMTISPVNTPSTILSFPMDVPNEIDSVQLTHALKEKQGTQDVLSKGVKGCKTGKDKVEHSDCNTDGEVESAQCLPQSSHDHDSSLALVRYQPCFPTTFTSLSMLPNLQVSNHVSRVSIPDENSVPPPGSQEDNDKLVEN